ncbi:hypothetical protein GGR51DRAFT_561978 [Nemania sp. FL0031]|nr:hypothetical protein GGR51DRAFT_561978 [Nemania sp. FL0031]
MAFSPRLPQLAAAHLAKLAREDIYPEQYISAEFDYYGVASNHLGLVDNIDSKVLQINIIKLETDEGLYAGGIEYANTYLNFKIDLANYKGKHILTASRYY